MMLNVERATQRMMLKVNVDSEDNKRYVLPTFGFEGQIATSHSCSRFSCSVTSGFRGIDLVGGSFGVHTLWAGPGGVVLLSIPHLSHRQPLGL